MSEQVSGSTDLPLGNDTKDESAPDLIHQVPKPGPSGLKSSVLPLDQVHRDQSFFITFKCTFKNVNFARILQHSNTNIIGAPNIIGAWAQQL